MLLTRAKVPMRAFFAALACFSISALAIAASATGQAEPSRATRAEAATPGVHDVKSEEKPLTERAKALNALKATYRLADHEDIKCIKPPYAEARQELLRVDSPQTERAALHFLWNKGQLKSWGGQFGNPAPPLTSWFYNLVGFHPEELEGDDALLKTPIEADFITREGVGASKLLPSLETILRKEFKLPVKLSLQKVRRKVYVASGDYEFKPVEGRPKDRIEIYANHLTEDAKVGGGGRGDLATFLKHVGQFVGQRVVAGDIKNVPKGAIEWHYNLRSPFTEEQAKEDRDPIAVFQRLSVQTGLGFREEGRIVMVVVVERKA